MIIHWYFVLLLCHGFIIQTKGLFRTRGIFPPSTDPNLLVENLVRKDNYPFEIHHVTTEDGYVLAVHRIPPTVAERNRRVVLIMHGLLGCSTDWIITGRNRSLAYLLSDNGYDVWLGNNRGTTNSKNHTKLSLQSAEFWDFSYHEMGIYDLPAMIDYILNQTGQRQLFYVGFSQGTTQFWILMSLKPEYNKKIKLMSALAPVAYMGNIEGILNPLSVLGNFFKGLFKYMGYFELLANTKTEKLITYEFCREGLITQRFCEMIIYMIGGIGGANETDHSHLVDYLQFAPAGCSFKQLLHFSTGIQHPGTFRFYDYGMLLNFKFYRQFVPPNYPLDKITAPVMLYNGLNDVLSHPKDVELLTKRLPNLLEKYTVTVKSINHFDFVYGKNVKRLVYDYLIEKMNSML